MKSNLDIEVRTSMEVDGVHLFINEELVLLIDNDPEDLVTIISLCIFSALEEQDKFIHRISQ